MGIYLPSGTTWLLLPSSLSMLLHGASHVVKNPPANAGDMSLIPWTGRSPRGGNGYLLQYSCLEISKDRGAWQDTVHGVSRVRHDWATKQQSSCVRQLLLCPPQGMFLKQSMIYSGELYSQMEAVEQICPWFYLAQHILILFALASRPES